ncbi:MAG: hypothetical protein GXO76_12910 [Calditrichaeota bacterium]|nr:hypothetical protein [Calditrichota bacterium]
MKRFFPQFRYSTGLIFILLSGSLFLFQCTPIARHRILSFFFDGVPPLKQTQNLQGKNGNSQSGVSSKTAAAESLSVAQPVFYYHPQTGDNRCDACHNVSQSYHLIASPDSLCLMCHDDKLDAKYVHPPVEDGECLECHNPHGSKNKHLVLETGQSLCFKCHDQSEIMDSEHKVIGKEPCTMCHNPHNSDNQYFLR